MLTTGQIILLAFLGFWMLVSIVTYAVLLKYTKKEYRKFYPHPIVNIQKNINSDNRFKFWEKLFIFTCLNIVYLPIICEWLIAWCLYKFWKFMCVDDTVECQAEKEILDFKTVNEECIENAKQIMEEGLNNPEYINEYERSKQSIQSAEFMDYLYSQNAQSMETQNINDLLQTDKLEVNKVEDVKNINSIKEEPSTTNNEQKPKRKYTKKNKPVEDEISNETKNT